MLFLVEIDLEQTQEEMMVLGNSTLWTKLYGSLGEQKRKMVSNGFDLKTYGLGLGYENEYKDGQLLGTGLFLYKYKC